MKKICQIAGKLFLGIAAVITSAGVASINGYAVEEMPKCMKDKR